MKQKLLIITCFSLILFSCKKDSVEPTPATLTVAASTQLNIAYGTNALQKMDVYLPANRSTTTTKVLIYVHGGAWVAGDKADLNGAGIDSIRKRLPDYAVFNVNYRLAALPSTNPFPAQELDVKAAVDFIYTNRTTNLVGDKFVMMGHSAGAHLSLLQAYKYQTPKIKAVVDFFGPNDMTDMYNNPASPSAPPSGIALLLNGPPPSALYTSSSPINFVTAQSPPTIILHGGADQLVRYQQSVALRNKLMLNAVAQQYVFYPLEGHGWIGANLIDSFDKVQAFLNLYVQ